MCCGIIYILIRLYHPDRQACHSTWPPSDYAAVPSSSRPPARSSVVRPPPDTVVRPPPDTAEAARGATTTQSPASSSEKSTSSQERLLETHGCKKVKEPRAALSAGDATQSKTTIDIQPTDFSKTAPWRVHPPSGAGEPDEAGPPLALLDALRRHSPSPETKARVHDASQFVSKVIQRKVLSERLSLDSAYPWRRQRTLSDSDIVPVEAAGGDEAGLTFVGQRTGLYSHDGDGEALPGEMYFAVEGANVELMSMPAVKEMVADLDRRLEAIAVQHPKIAQRLSSAAEPGLAYGHYTAEARMPARGSLEREIFIDSAPSVGRAPDAYGYRRSLSANVSPARSPALSPALSPSLSPRGSQRRVHFAEPLEQSVIEIESRGAHSGRPLVHYDDSLKTLSDTLDRIERENQLVSRGAHPAGLPPPPGRVSPLRADDRPLPPGRLDSPLHVYQTPTRNILVSGSAAAAGPAQPATRGGLSVTIGQAGPYQFNVSLSRAPRVAAPGSRATHAPIEFYRTNPTAREAPAAAATTRSNIIRVAYPPEARHHPSPTAVFTRSSPNRLSVPSGGVGPYLQQLSVQTGGRQSLSPRLSPQRSPGLQQDRAATDPQRRGGSPGLIPATDPHRRGGSPGRPPGNLITVQRRLAPRRYSVDVGATGLTHAQGNVK